MTILETLAVFVGGPLVLYVVIAVGTVIPARAKRRAQYKPGQTWELAPQWWAGDVPVVVGDSSGSDNAKGGARGTW